VKEEGNRRPCPRPYSLALWPACGPPLLPPVGGPPQGEATEWTRKWFLKSTLLAACGGPSLRQGGGGEEEEKKLLDNLFRL